jgi:hypothetical protein
VPAGRFLAAAPGQGWTFRSLASPRAKRVLIHRLRRAPGASGKRRAVPGAQRRPYTTS